MPSSICGRLRELHDSRSAGTAAVEVEVRHRGPQHAVLAAPSGAARVVDAGTGRSAPAKKPPAGTFQEHPGRPGRREAPVQARPPGGAGCAEYAARSRVRRHAAGSRARSSTPPTTAWAIDERVHRDHALDLGELVGEQAAVAVGVAHPLVGDHVADPGPGQHGLGERAQVDHPPAGVQGLERRARRRRRGEQPVRVVLDQQQVLARAASASSRRRSAGRMLVPDGLAKSGIT